MDYSEEEDYYSQGFERSGVVSVWFGINDESDDSSEFDVLQDLCGVGYYELSDQESQCFDYKLVSIKQLFSEISYSNSFKSDVIKSAETMGIKEARWAVFQFDFEYDPDRVHRSISIDPLYIGAFNYEA